MDPLDPIDPEKMPQQQPDAQSLPNRSDGEDPEVKQPAFIDSPPPASDGEGIVTGAPEDQPMVDPESVGAELVASQSSFQLPLTTARPSATDGDALPPANLDFEPVNKPRDLPAGPFGPPLSTAEFGPDPTAAPLDAPPLPDISGPDLTGDRSASPNAWAISNVDPSAGTPADTPVSLDIDRTVPPDSSTMIEPVPELSNSPGALAELPKQIADRGVMTPDGSAVDGVKALLSEPHPEPVDQPSDEAIRAGLDVNQILNDYNARTRALLSPAVDGGPPMARPIVLVSLAQEQSQLATQEALAAAAARISKTAAEVAQDKVHEGLWIRDCEMRAVMGGW